MNCDFLPFVLPLLTKPDAGAPTVLIDKLDVSGLKRSANSPYCFSSATQFPVIGRLEPSDGWFRHARMSR
jgi:hypothetical protein